MTYKVAIVQDELIRRAGGEKVGLCFHYAFPEAPIYTIAYRENDTFEEYKQCDVRTSWFNRFANNEKALKKYFFPFGIIAMKQLNLTAYDIVIQSGTHCSKYVKVNKNALVITYCYTPFRLAWNPTSYTEYLDAKGFRKLAFDLVVSILKKIDKSASKRSDYFISMTQETRERVAEAYEPKKPVAVIPPPVTVKNFYLSNENGDYYFLLSRLEYYKRVDLVVKAFNKIGKPLIIVGKGSKEQELKDMANPNITFYKGLSNEEIGKLYAKCKAFLMPQHEDYGITPLEANASGRPVIAYRAGGVLETMVPFEGDQQKYTAVFFNEQTEDSLIKAVEKFEELTFNSNFIRQNSERFDDEVFIQRAKNFVLEKAAEKF